MGFGDVAGGHGVVVEGDAVGDADDEEGPVGPRLGDGGRAGVVYGEEEVGGGVQRGEDGDEFARAWRGVSRAVLFKNLRNLEGTYEDVSLIAAPYSVSTVSPGYRGAA